MSGRNARPIVALAILALGLGADLGAEPTEQSAPGAGDGAAGTSAATALAARIKSPPLPGSFGKPAPPIAIAYELSATPQLGVPFDVRISVEGHGGIADLALSVNPGSGIEAGTPQLTTSSADGARRTWTVAATVFDDHAQYLSVLARGTVGDLHPARNLLIPIRIGAAASAGAR